MQADKIKGLFGKGLNASYFLWNCRAAQNLGKCVAENMQSDVICDEDQILDLITRWMDENHYHTYWFNRYDCDCMLNFHLTIQLHLCLTHSHTMTPFDTMGNKPFENTVGKGEIACNEQFLLYPQCFLPV